MKHLLKFLFCVSLLAISCNPQDDDGPEYLPGEDNYGIVNFSFVYEISALPDRRIKRLSLRIAYTQDSLNHGQFFTSTNVSDAVKKYQLFLPQGIYYYQATIMCLCGGDSCKYAGFSKQFGTMNTGSKIEVLKDQVTEVTTQFH